MDVRNYEAGQDQKRKNKGPRKVKKNSKNPKIIWKWVGGSRSHLDKKKLENCPKIKFCICRAYNSPLLGGARDASRCACMQHFIPYSVIL